jgi:RsiW-degrading membrane proteinase PrsW (M82 family)
MFAFILFAILGWAVFASPQGNGRTVLMIVFVVMLVLWLLQGLGAFTLPYGGGKW